MDNKAPLQAAQPNPVLMEVQKALDGLFCLLHLKERSSSKKPVLPSKHSSVSALHAVGQEASSLAWATWKVGKSLCKVSLESMETVRGDLSRPSILKLSCFPTYKSSSWSRTETALLRVCARSSWMALEGYPGTRLYPCVRATQGNCHLSGTRSLLEAKSHHQGRCGQRGGAGLWLSLRLNPSRLADSVCYSFPPATDKDSLRGNLPRLFITEIMPLQSAIPKAKETRKNTLIQLQGQVPGRGAVWSNQAPLGFKRASRNRSKRYHQPVAPFLLGCPSAPSLLNVRRWKLSDVPIPQDDLHKLIHSFQAIAWP